MLSEDLSAWVVQLCAAETSRRDGQDVYFPQPPFVDASDAVVGAALSRHRSVWSRAFPASD